MSMTKKKVKKIRLVSCFLAGVFITLLFWLSLSPFFDIEFGLFSLIIVIPLSVLIVQDEHFTFFPYNVASYFAGLILSLVAEIVFDFIHILFSDADVEMNAGDGLGVIISAPFYILAVLLIVVISNIITNHRSKRTSDADDYDEEKA